MGDGYTLVVNVPDDPRNTEVQVYGGSLDDQHREDLKDHHTGDTLIIESPDGGPGGDYGFDGMDDWMDAEWLRHGSYVPWAVSDAQVELMYRGGASANMSIKAEDGHALLDDRAFELEEGEWYHLEAAWDGDGLRRFDIERAGEDYEPPGGDGP